MTHASPADVRRYIDLLTAALPVAARVAEGVVSPEVVRVEHGVGYAAAVRDPLAVDRASSAPPPVPTAPVVDRLGHRRPAYRGLLAYAWLQTYRLVRADQPHDAVAAWDAPLRAWADAMARDVATVDVTAANLVASKGDALTGVAWAALALDVAGTIFGRDAWRAAAADTFTKLARAQQRSGAFLRTTASDNPEPWWYHELVLLHAAGSYAVQAGDDAVAAAVARAAEFHQNETQPDHASAQPWALFPLVWNRATHPLADQVFHAATAEHPGGLDGISLMLVADALYCLRVVASGELPVASEGKATDVLTGQLTTINYQLPMSDTRPNNVLDPELLDLLRCPLTHSRLRQEGDFLVAEAGGLAYPVRDGIPVMLVEEARLPAGFATLEEFRKANPSILAH